jgi:hypothetical protein
MIELQAHLNGFPYLPECGQSDCAVSHPETVEYIYGCFDAGISGF